ncbi:MAG: hypothetical protein JSU83_02325 [Deltaproteobacteria bacterium]|nr:MAG: hypothetical protein JSU83_02325 [Deltaproteobacteria bacterium]
MKKMVSIISSLVFSLWIFASCSGSKPIPEEEDVLDALTKVQGGIESKVSYSDFEKLLAAAKQKIDILKQIEKKNDCFLNAVNKCYASYEISQKAWQQKDMAKDEKRKEDMEITLSFSLGFASVSLAKANECFIR